MWIDLISIYLMAGIVFWGMILPEFLQRQHRQYGLMFAALVLCLLLWPYLMWIFGKMRYKHYREQKRSTK